MINEETYKKELVRMWDDSREYFKGHGDCSGVKCEECPIHETGCGDKTKEVQMIDMFKIINVVEKWSKEHPSKKYKVSKLEYDIMRATIKYSSNDDSFYDVDILFDLIQKGYFKGACGNMFIHYYFDNCEVEEDDG